MNIHFKDNKSKYFIGLHMRCFFKDLNFKLHICGIIREIVIE
jgi:hypothetical protein